MNIFYRNKLLHVFVLVILLCIFCTGCSILELNRGYITEIDNPKLIKISNPPNTYPKEIIQYKDAGLLLTLKAGYGTSVCPVSIGPPVIPIIPLFCFGEGRLFFNFIFESFGNPLTVNVQGITLITPSGKSIAHDNSYFCTTDNVFSFECTNKRNATGSNYGLTKAQITSPVTVIDKGMFSLEWPMKDVPDKIKIEFGNISSAGKNINLPPVVLYKESNILYCPLMLTGHEPCIR